jgi:tetratricopeptide (TPR) repeat protein
MEGVALLRHALDVALEHDKPSAALRGYFNLSDTLSHLDRYEDADVCVREGISYARRVGNRRYELQFLAQTYPLFALGKWDELIEWTLLLPEDHWVDARQAYATVSGVGVAVNALRGQLDEAERISSMLAEFATSGDAQERASHKCGTAWLRLAKGDPAGALQDAEATLEAAQEMGFTQEYVKEALVVALEAALELGNLEKAYELLGLIDGIPPGHSPQFLQAQSMRFRARLAGSDGPEAERLFKGATGLFRELAVPFYLATTQLEYAEWAAAQGRADDAARLVAEAREIFERLGARPWLERAEKVGGVAQVPA